MWRMVKTVREKRARLSPRLAKAYGAKVPANRGVCSAQKHTPPRVWARATKGRPSESIPWAPLATNQRADYAGFMGAQQDQCMLKEIGRTKEAFCASSDQVGLIPLVSTDCRALAVFGARPAMTPCSSPTRAMPNAAQGARTKKDA